MEDRINQIVRCMDEIAICRHDQSPDNWGSFLGEMDWLAQLHQLLYPQEELSRRP